MAEEESALIFIALDADDRETLWGHNVEKPEMPFAILSKQQVPEPWRNAVWDALTKACEPENRCDSVNDSYGVRCDSTYVGAARWHFGPHVHRGQITEHISRVEWNNDQIPVAPVAGQGKAEPK